MTCGKLNLAFMPVADDKAKRFLDKFSGMGCSTRKKEEI